MRAEKLLLYFIIKHTAKYTFVRIDEFCFGATAWARNFVMLMFYLCHFVFSSLGPTHKIDAE